MAAICCNFNCCNRWSSCWLGWISQRRSCVGWYLRLRVVEAVDVDEVSWLACTLKIKEILVFCYNNCSDLLWRQIFLKFVHFKKTIAQSSFLSKYCHFCWNQNKVSENDNTFERNEDCATVFLKWTDFSVIWIFPGYVLGSQKVNFWLSWVFFGRSHH